MVKTLVLFDAPHAAARQALEAVLRAHGFLWLFPNARWSASGGSASQQLIRQIRRRLANHVYRILIIELRGRAAPGVQWVTSALGRT